MIEDARPAIATFARHDHARCRADALREVETQCQARGLRFTDIRRKVLEILLESHTALGAYDVLARLDADGRAAQPPVAYRALDFLVANGFAHRIESLNAFVACVCPHDSHRAAFLICRACRKVAETPAAAAREALAPDAGALGFRIEGVTVEAHGLCPVCATTEQRP